MFDVFVYIFAVIGAAFSLVSGAWFLSYATSETVFIFSEWKAVRRGRDIYTREIWEEFRKQKDTLTPEESDSVDPSYDLKPVRMVFQIPFKDLPLHLEKTDYPFADRAVRWRLMRGK